MTIEDFATTHQPDIAYAHVSAACSMEYDEQRTMDESRLKSGESAMMKTVWAEVRNGTIVPLEEIGLAEGTKVLVTVVDESDEQQFWLRVSQDTLARVWDNEQDEVYAHLL